MNTKNTYFITAISATLFLSCCSNKELFKEFDDKSYHITDPIVKIMKSQKPEKLKLDYIEKYHPDALVCFFPAYGHADVFRTNLTPEIIKKYKISKNMRFVPADRPVYDNEMGLAVISRGVQYNYSIKNELGISKYYNNETPVYHCSEANNAIIQKIQGKEITRDMYGNQTFPLSSILIEERK